MPRKKRSAKKKLTEKQRLAEARKALNQTQQVLNQTQQVLEAELTKVKGYVKSLDWHIWFKI